MNQGPPEDVPATALWLALTAIPRPHKLVDFPRRLPGTEESVGQVAMWPLTQEEQMACSAEADRFTKKLLKDGQKKDEANLGYETMFSNEVAVQILYRACRDATDLERPAFPSPSQLRQALTADEVGALFKHYLTVQLELGPIVAHLSDEEMEAWVKRIGEGGSAFPFDLLSWEMQRALVLFMASRLTSSPTDTLSAGSPPEESQTSSESEQPPRNENDSDNDAASGADG